MKLNFNKKYFLLFILLFITEVLIALYVNDSFIRPYFGDYLVVFLVYCFVMSFLKANKYKMALAVLVFAFTVEFLQYVDFVTIVGLQKSRLARTVIGTSFSFEDLLLYFLAYLTITSLEKYLSKSRSI
ncbi:DUF2809 domain-containing protein [Flavobacterium sp.]|uniref:ribosomal maturation YjgA family protein n=1 Tax=Flavobacterium sp. TaxID=239 RepID=UPI003753B9E9